MTDDEYDKNLELEAWIKGYLVKYYSRKNSQIKVTLNMVECFKLGMKYQNE